MINCHYNPIDEADFFRRVVADKYENYRLILLPICDRVEQAYQEYLQDFPALCLRPQSIFAAEERDQKDALQKCYSIETQTFKLFKSDFGNAQSDVMKTLCPYCMMNTPDTFDHYVGQAAFPEYSILTKNLVPCCWKCNHNKKEQWRNAGNRTYINFYDDQFLQYPFLTADLIHQPGDVVPAISYRLFQPLEITDADFEIINSHFQNLRLIEKYNLRANSRISTGIEAVKNFFNLGWDDLTAEDFLLSQYRSMAAKNGVNNWEAIVYRTLSENLSLIRAL